MTRRPPVVLFLGVLLLAQALFQAVAAVTALLLRENPRIEAATALSSGDLVRAGIAGLVIAAITTAVGAGLLAGSRISRGVVAFAEVLTIATAAWQMVYHHTGALVLHGAVAAAWGVFVLWALFGDRADAHFSARHATGASADSLPDAHSRVETGAAAR